MSGPLLLGAVVYDAKVVTIWTGFRAWLRARGFAFDYLLYSNYERQVTDLLAGRIDVAWNSPLAWVRAHLIAAAGGTEVRPIAMRDTDRDLRSVVVVRAESPVQAPADLRGRVVGVGAVDSPQATLIPLGHLRTIGIDPGRAIKVRRFDIGVGLHGDHIGGERAAAAALHAGTIDAACMTDANLLLFSQEGTLVPSSVRVVAQTQLYDHCNMTAGPGADPTAIADFVQMLLDMDYGDPAARTLLDLEGLKAWLPGRTSGYAALTAAVHQSGFYDERGRIGAHDYQP